MDDDYDGDEDNPYKDFETTREGVIFCIDTSDTMLQGVDENDHCYLQRCFMCVRDRLLYNIMLSDKEFVGIMLLGARAITPAGSQTDSTSATPAALDGVAALLQVSRPGAEIIKTLNNYINCANFGTVFKRDFETGVECSLADALWDCQSRLSVSNTKFGAKEVFIMTCNDQSHIDAALRRQVCKRAEALMQVGISLRLLYLGAQFNLEAFYKELLLAAHPAMRNQEFNAAAEKFAASNLDRVPGAALTRSSFNRHLFRLDWTIAKDVTMTVLLYPNYRARKVYEPRKIVELDQRSNVRVKGTVTCFDTEGEVVAYSQIYKGVKIGDREAFFTTKEQSQMREIFPVGLTLLGFKPLGSVFLEDHVRPGELVLPDDSTRPGSSTLFHALLRRCLERKEVPLCRIVLRMGTRAKLAYLLPQEQGDASLGTLGVAGFQAIYAPFAGEYRECGKITENEANDDQKKAADAIIRKLRTGNFDIENFKNPEQRTYFHAVEALALEYDSPEPLEDPLEPDVAVIDARIGPMVATFLSLVAPIAGSEASQSQASSSGRSSQAESELSRGSQRGRGRPRGTGRGARRGRLPPE